jgi:hypothetical protein
LAGASLGWKMKKVILDLFEDLFEVFRLSIAVVSYLWAVLSFLFGYFGDFIEFELDDAGFEGPVGRAAFRNLYVPILKVLMVALTSTAASAFPVAHNRDPATVHYMDMNSSTGQYK